MTYDLDRVAAEDQITRLLFAYCSGIDDGRLDDMARLFEKGTWFLNDETPFTGFDAVSTFLRENVLLYDGVPATRHAVSNIGIDLAEDRTEAQCRSYVIVYQCVPGSAPQIIFQGAYDDTFACSDGTWHFVERHIITDGTGDMSMHLRGAQAVGSGSL